MKKIEKNNKCGFTLVEMVLVIFIILVMSGVLLYGIMALVDRSRTSSDKVDEHAGYVDSAADEVHDIVSDRNISY